MTQHIFDAHCLLNEYMNLELLTVTLNRWKMPLKNEDRQKKKKKIPAPDAKPTASHRLFSQIL